jgi:hypothetical protein
MVRAGVVADPRQWRWCSYAELQATGEAKPLVDRGRVAELLGCGTVEQMRTHWEEQIGGWLERRRLQREACWTESVAVGRRAFVDWVIWQVQGRKRWQIAEQSLRGDGSKMWSVREHPGCYG